MSYRNLKHRGLALVVVLGVVALASMIGFAMLASSSMQVQVSRNMSQSASAEYAAESAVQAGLYYLQYPSRAPASWTTTPGYLLYATNQSLGNDFVGTFDLEVQQTTTRNQYTIRAAGRASAASTARVITALVSVERTGISSVGLFGGNITIPTRTTVTGHVQAEGSITNNSTSPSMTTTSGPLGPTAYQVPSATSVNFYGADKIDGKYICPDGTVGYAQQLLTTPLVDPAALVTNPGRVFYWNSTTTPDLILSTPVTINGTLVVKGGSLLARASGIKINPVAGYPALVVEKDVEIYRTNVSLEANGVVWIGRDLRWTTQFGSNSGSSFIVKGALLMPAGSTIGTPGTGGQNVFEYDVTKVNVPDLNSKLQPGTTVKILAWND